MAGGGRRGGCPGRRAWGAIMSFLRSAKYEKIKKLPEKSLIVYKNRKTVKIGKLQSMG